MEATHPYLSPLHHPFHAKTPVWIQVGGAEILHDEIVTFKRRMDEVEGNKTGLYKVPIAPHDILLAGHINGFANEAADASGATRRFLES